MPNTGKKTIKDYKKLASFIGMQWIGEELPANTTIKTDWICKKGHITTRSYKKIRLRPKCPRCHGFKFGREDYLTIAARRNHQWLGPMPKRSTEKTRWLCDKGHEFAKSYSQMKRQPGCEFCAHVQRRNTQLDYDNLAIETGLRWLGPLPSSTKAKTNWRCRRGHEFKSRFNDIQQGYGCNKCNVRGTSRFELRVLAECQSIFREVNWRHKVDGVECDLFLPERNIAVEIDGSYWHKGKEKSDLQKNALLSDRGIRVIRLREDPLQEIGDHDICYKHRANKLPVIKKLYVGVFI